MVESQHLGGKGRRVRSSRPAWYKKVSSRTVWDTWDPVQKKGCGEGKWNKEKIIWGLNEAQWKSAFQMWKLLGSVPSTREKKARESMNEHKRKWACSRENERGKCCIEGHEWRRFYTTEGLPMTHMGPRNHLGTRVSNTLMPVVATGYKLNKATLGWVYFISRVNYTLIKLGLKPVIQDLITQGKSLPITLSFHLSCLHCSCSIHSNIEQETWKKKKKQAKTPMS